MDYAWTNIYYFSLPKSQWWKKNLYVILDSDFIYVKLHYREVWLPAVSSSITEMEGSQIHNLQSNNNL